MIELLTQSDSATLGWRFAWPGWAWFALAVAALAAAGWSYRRLLGPMWARIALAFVRGLLIMVILILIAGPSLVRRQEQIQPDSLIVLVDRSASLRVKDQPAGGSFVTRDQALTSALEAQRKLFSKEQLGKDRKVLWLGFDSGTFALSPRGGDTQLAADRADSAADARADASFALGPPDGYTTALRTAIEQAMQRAAGSPVSGIVLLSDGRSPEPLDRVLVSALKQQSIKVFPVPLGSKSPPLDLAVGRVDAPDKALLNDIVPVAVWVDNLSPGEPLDPARIRVRVFDAATDKLLDESRAGDGLSQPVRLSVRSKTAGLNTWRVELDIEGDESELITENNRKQLQVELIDRAIRVLYVDGYPRWEYRYLKNLLVREKSIESSVLLLSADTSFAQEGDKPITRLPAESDEWKPFDVVILGDVRSSDLGEARMKQLASHVQARGAGLMMIGGERWLPSTYRGTPLSALLPMRRIDETARVSISDGPIAMQPTKLSESLQLFRFRDASGRLAGQDGWPNDLPPFEWAQALGKLKVGVEALATGHTQDGGPFPLITRMRFGGGQAIYLASDETWRWRYGKGDLYTDQFWTQLIQMLARHRLQQGGREAWLEVSHRRVRSGATLKLRLHLDAARLTGQAPPKRITIEVVAVGDKDNRVLDRIDLLPVKRDSEDAGDTDALDSASATGIDYEALWQPSASGRLELRVAESALDDLALKQTVEVIRPDDEIRDPAANHAVLERLARDTGGQVVPLDDLPQLASLIQSRSVRSYSEWREPLWNTPLALVVVLVLLSIEWIGRKLIRLV